jgi:hypothetical protein
MNITSDHAVTVEMPLLEANVHEKNGKRQDAVEGQTGRFVLTPQQERAVNLMPTHKRQN